MYGCVISKKKIEIRFCGIWEDTQPRREISQTIMMNAQIESAFKAMLDQHTTAMVEALAGKYGFDATDALKHLQTTEAPKVKKGKGKGAAIKPSDKPEKAKRGPNAYMQWANQNREAVKSKHPEMSGRELTKELGRIWRVEVSDDTKEAWKAWVAGAAAAEAPETADGGRTNHRLRPRGCTIRHASPAGRDVDTGAALGSGDTGVRSRRIAE